MIFCLGNKSWRRRVVKKSLKVSKYWNEAEKIVKYRWKCSNHCEDRSELKNISLPKKRIL